MGRPKVVEAAEPNHILRNRIADIHGNGDIRRSYNGRGDGDGHFGDETVAGAVRWRVNGRFHPPGGASEDG